MDMKLVIAMSSTGDSSCRKYSWMIVPILRQPTRHNGGSREPLDFPISSTNERRRETREATIGRHRVHRQWRPLWQPPSTGSRS